MSQRLALSQAAEESSVALLVSPRQVHIGTRPKENFLGYGGHCRLVIRVHTIIFDLLFHNVIDDQRFVAQ